MLQCVLDLCENPLDVFLEASSVLLRLSGNILRDPSNQRYRSVRLANPTVEAKLMPAMGGLDCLFEMGFHEGEDSLVLPSDAPLDKVKVVYQQIQEKRDKAQGTETVGEVTQESPVVTASATVETPAMSTPLVTSPPPVMASALSKEEDAKAQFLHHMDVSESLVRRYELKTLQELALRHIPPNVLNATHENDAVLKSLLGWFKREFFAWVDRPACPKCKGQGDAASGAGDVGMVPPTSEELQYGATRVERYVCGTCGDTQRFPRFNDPVKLLETRKGRCGEWANCFTLMCRAIGYDVRYVYDWNDHVWTEVYSASLGRWVHLDPCECVYDQPLLYEQGWGKKLSYVIAFAHDDVQDVTWRYVSDYNAARERRNVVPEEWLLDEITRRRNVYIEGASTERRTQVLDRTARELAEFLSPSGKPRLEYQGRTTGSLQWRQARGEAGVPRGLLGGTPTSTLQPYTWRPTLGELQSLQFKLEYCAATDKYVHGNQAVQGWVNGVYELDNVFRKEEHDWGVAYLARTEGSKRGMVCWKVSCEGTGVVISSVQLTLSHTVFEDGMVSWIVCCGEFCTRLATSGTHNLDDVKGSESIEVKAIMSKGKGAVAWQHAQVCRQTMDSTEPALVITVQLMKPESP